jgi:hypothetical protein
MLLLVKNLLNISVLATFCPVFGHALAIPQLAKGFGF